MSDNKTSHIAKEYDANVEKTMPFYSFFHNETLSLIKVVQPNPCTWLDTGCGTGALVSKAAAYFGNTKFILADPAEAMLAIAKERFAGSELKIEYLLAGTQDINYPKESLAVITAIQAHHYFAADIREKATANCFKMLQKGGIYVTFENIKPSTADGTCIGLKRWQEFQQSQGRSDEQVAGHLSRFNVEYFPITIERHIRLLHEAGFQQLKFSGLQECRPAFMR